MVNSFIKSVNAIERKKMERRIIKTWLSNYCNKPSSRSGMKIAKELEILRSDGIPDKDFVCKVITKYKKMMKSKNLIEDSGDLRPANNPRTPKKYGYVRYCEDDLTERQIPVEEQIKKLKEVGVKKSNIFIEIGHNGGFLKEESRVELENDGLSVYIINNRGILNKLLKVIKSDDEVYVWDFQKLSRSVLFSEFLIDIFVKKNVKWFVLDGVNDIMSIRFKVLYSNDALKKYWLDKGRRYN